MAKTHQSVNSERLHCSHNSQPRRCCCSFQRLFIGLKVGVALEAKVEQLKERIVANEVPLSQRSTIPLAREPYIVRKCVLYTTETALEIEPYFVARKKKGKQSLLMSFSSLMMDALTQRNEDQPPPSLHQQDESNPLANLPDGTLPQPVDRPLRYISKCIKREEKHQQGEHDYHASWRKGGI